MVELQEELKKISGMIDKVIKSDDFPSVIAPRFLQDAVIQYPYHGGKRLRPAILMWCNGLLGGNPDAAVYAAAAVEIYHNWTLVHDDIIDNDNFRRGEPSTHKFIADFALKNLGVPKAACKKFGTDYAILAGDIQHGWAMNMLMRSSSHGVSAELTLALAKRMQDVVNRMLISGQGLDLSYPFRDIDSFVAEEIENMLFMKTGILLSFCAETGALLALGAPLFEDPGVAALYRFATFIGIAFQLKDDWLGVFGDSEKLGKPTFSDFVNAKPTVLAVKTVDLLKPDERAKFRALLGLRKYDSDTKDLVRSYIRDSGAEKYVLDKISKFSADAKNLLRPFPNNKYKQLLTELVDWLIQRDK